MDYFHRDISHLRHFFLMVNQPNCSDSFVYILLTDCNLSVRRDYPDTGEHPVVCVEPLFRQGCGE